MADAVQRGSQEATMAKRDQQGARPGESRPMSIGALSRATRIPVETLRTWERRYGSPMPIRKPSGHRVYPAATVEQLRRVGRLLSQGHRPAEILGLPVRELDKLLSIGEPAAALPAEAAAAAVSSDESAAATVAELVRATRAFDREALLRELRASWARLGPVRFLEAVAGGFMLEVGRAWSARELDIRHEHFASAALSDFLRRVREPFDERARGPRVVAALLPGDEHEGGLLIAALLLASRGCRVVYLGPNTPVDQVAAAVLASNAEAVAVSVSAAVPKPRASAALLKLRKALPARVPVWAGGAGAPARTRGVERFETLAALDTKLASL